MKKGAEDRYQEIHDSIALEIQKVKKSLDRLHPISQFMRFFRNSGILTFYFILISSSLFISSAIALAFILIGVLSTIYFNYKSLVILFDGLIINIQRFFVRQSLWVAISGILMVVSALILRIFLKLEYTNILLSLGLMVMVTGHIVYFILLPKHDAKFISKNRILNSWKLIRNAMAVIELVLFFGFILKLNGLTGGNELIMLSLTALVIFMFFYPIRYTTHRILAIIYGIAFFFLLMGIQFKVLHLEGANEMIILSVPFIIILIVLFILQRRKFHKSIMAYFGSLVILGFLILSGSSTLISTAYIFKERSLVNIERINSLEKSTEDYRFLVVVNSTSDIEAMTDSINHIQNEINWLSREYNHVHQSPLHNVITEHLHLSTEYLLLDSLPKPGKVDLSIKTLNALVPLKEFNLEDEKWKGIFQRFEELGKIEEINSIISVNAKEF